jgi:signal transduction histidine kinase
MRRSLYFKILSHWVGTLVITEILVFGLFVLVVKDGHRSYIQESIGRSTLISRDFLEAVIAHPRSNGTAAGARLPKSSADAPSSGTAAGAPGEADADAGAALRDAVRRLAANAHAKVWVSRGGAPPLAASFAGEVREPRTSPENSARVEGALITVGVGPDRLSYAAVPVNLGAPLGGEATLHILSEREAGRFPHGMFAAGLALIGVLVALIAIPLTRHITRPLKRLQDSALRIAGGDLASRADVQGSDEIGRLGSAFNSMAQTVERMVRAGRELTANVSHEMRSPLTRIRVAGECLKGAVSRGDSADAEELLAGMWEDIEEADRMIGRILEYSKLDLQESDPAPREVAPEALVHGLLKTMNPLFRAKMVAVELKVEPELYVTGDEEWLRAALKNLLENAARYTPEGGRVRVSLRPEGSAVRFEVTNSCAGVAAEDLERIFAPFYRGKGSPSEGTGLGLAITRKIVLMHQGDIGAQNTPEGFLVWFWLPRQAGGE